MTKDKKCEVPLWTSCRVAISVVSFIGFVNLYALRVNISVAMVCMVKRVNKTAVETAGNWSNASWIPDSGNNSALRLYSSWDIKNIADVGNRTDDKVLCEGLESSVSDSGDVDRGEFEWSKSLTGLMLSSFFYGYITTQIIGGWLAGRFGGRHVLGSAMVIYCAMALLTPVAARTHPYLVIAVRVIMGIVTGVVFPAMHAIWGQWAPPLERSKLMTVCYSGTSIGYILGMSVSGVLCAYGFDNGWPSIFYVFGGVCALWLICWYYTVYDCPRKHPRITEAERDYIESSIGDRSTKKRVTVPWMKFASSRAVWGIVLAHMCNNWGNYTLMTSLPAYMKEVLKFDIKQNGGWSALPHTAFFVCTIIIGQIADCLRRKRILRTTAVRKLFQAIGGFVPAIFMVATGFVDCTNRMLGVAFLTIAVAATAACQSGYMVNHVDIAPRYAGHLFGISNTMATIPGMVSPSVIAALTPNRTTSEWQNVFWISGAVYSFGALMYLLLGSGEKQPWATLDNDEEEDNDNKSEINAFFTADKKESGL